MTPQEIADIGYPVEQLYERMTDELLLNIAKHLNSPTNTWTALHEIETLGTMGQLTEENIKIINKYVQMIPEAVKNAMNDSRLVALQEIEDKLQKAAQNGYLTEPVTDSTVDVTKALSEQALSQLNLVNQTMLDSSLAAYQSGVYEMRQGMRSIQSIADLGFAQSEIDLATAQTIEGTETRISALRKTIRRLNQNGITGFIDRAGRSWSAEAYVNMDIRTTVHNTYIQTVKARQEDYGSDVFQVSAHAGARPLCYPYQGKLYSWSHVGGYITLGDGRRYRFENINTTSYGEPAGLFGINCGHVPYPMIPGVSEKVDEDIPPKKENDKEYKESQQQRSLERKIRYQKRELEMLGSLATDEDRQKLRNAQSDMRAFIKQTGRARRYDREQIEVGSTKRPINVKGVTAIENYPSGKIDPKVVKTFDEAIDSTGSKYRIKLNAITSMTLKESLDNIGVVADTDTTSHIIRYNPLYYKNEGMLKESIADYVKKRWCVKVAEEDYTKYPAVHESKHLILDVEKSLPKNRAPKTDEERAAVAIQNIFDEYKKRINDLDAIIKETDDDSLKKEFSKILISRYSLRNADEFMAEAATMADIGLKPNEYAKKVEDILNIYMGV